MACEPDVVYFFNKVISWEVVGFDGVVLFCVGEGYCGFVDVDGVVVSWHVFECSL